MSPTVAVEPVSGLVLAQAVPQYVPWAMLGFGLMCMYAGASIIQTRQVYRWGRAHAIGKLVAILAGLTCLLLGALSCAAGALLWWGGPR